MQQRDLVLRWIEAFGQMLARIKKLIGEGDTERAAEAIAKVASESGVDLKMAKVLTGQSLLQLLSPNPVEVDPTRAMIFAELLYLDGLRAQEAGAEAEARDNFAKALLLLQSATSHGNIVGSRTAEVDARVQELGELLEADA